ncbi:MAG: tol-pal system protein YbgF [Gammaproteobacteria bacterium]|nr:tol-pal system protein YbgF [Gammaproteobacteria bacterium]
MRITYPTPRRRLIFSPITLLLLLLVTASAAFGAETLEQRIARLERMQDSKVMLEMLQRMESMTRELEKLRGALEESQHLIESLKNRQRELYVDMDTRLTRLERSSSETGSVSATLPALDGGESAPPSDEEQMKYQEAFALLRKLNYEQAIAAFEKLAVGYPKGHYTPLAYYWMAEANYARREYARAVADYDKLIKSFPAHSKVAEALLKSAYSQIELKAKDRAEALLKQVIERYPGSSEAKQASDRLQQIGR